MAKNRNKKKHNNGVVNMGTGEPIISDIPQAMDTTESGAHIQASGGLIRSVLKILFAVAVAV
uniref:Uncharacterized protein LOC107430330 n=1 Tax=Rhizophora mucronata TaxID=61149 RepID=A0A2P2JW94_RHIMU